MLLAGALFSGIKLAILERILSLSLSYLICILLQLKQLNERDNCVGKLQLTLRASYQSFNWIDIRNRCRRALIPVNYPEFRIMIELPTPTWKIMVKHFVVAEEEENMEINTQLKYIQHKKSDSSSSTTSSEDLTLCVESHEHEIDNLGSNFLLKNLLISEEAYGKQLNMVWDLYFRPLFKTDHFRKLFAKEEALNDILPIEFYFIRSLSDKFATDLKKLKNLERIDTLCELINRYIPFFKVYSIYNSKLPNSIKSIHSLKQTNSDFNQYIETCNELWNRVNNCSNKKSDDIVSLLLIPTLRLQRYVVFIEHLMKFKKSCDSGYAELHRAETMLKKLADLQVEQTEQIRNSEIMDRLSKKLRIPNFIIPGRKFLKKCRMEIKKFEKYHYNSCKAYLFNDILIIRSKRSSKLKKYVSYPVSNLSVTKMGSNILDVTMSSGVFQFQFPTEAETQVWKECLENVSNGDIPRATTTIQAKKTVNWTLNFGSSVIVLK